MMKLLFKILDFSIYIKKCENGEKVHFLATRSEEEGSVKFWICSNGGISIADGLGNYKVTELRDLAEFMYDYNFNRRIVEEWVFLNRYLKFHR